MTADIEITKLLRKLPKNTPLGEKAYNAIFERIKQRRKVWSDILWKISMEESDNDANIFYSDVSDLAIESFYKSFQREIINSLSIEDKAKNPEKHMKSFCKDKLLKISLNVRPTSVSCERTFSLCSRICIPLRGRMSEETLNIIVFLNENFHIM